MPISVLIVSMVCVGTLFYSYPRWLVSSFGESHYLSPYLYLYGLGVPIFVFNMWLMVRNGGMRLNIPGEKRWIFIFMCGLACSFVLHTLWVVVATYFPFKGL